MIFCSHNSHNDAVPTIDVAGIVPPVKEQLTGRNQGRLVYFRVYSCGASAVRTHNKVKLILNIMRLFTNFMLKLFACFHFKDNWSQ